MGFIDKFGKEIIPFNYDYVRNFDEGLAAVIKANKLRFIDKFGKEVSSFFNYGYVTNFNNGFAIIAKKDVFGNYNKQGLINKIGEIIVSPCKYDRIDRFNSDLIIVAKSRWFSNNKLGIVDKTGKEIVRANMKEYMILMMV